MIKLPKTQKEVYFFSSSFVRIMEDIDLISRLDDNDLENGPLRVVWFLSFWIMWVSNSWPCSELYNLFSLQWAIVLLLFDLISRLDYNGPEKRTTSYCMNFKLIWISNSLPCSDTYNLFSSQWAIVLLFSFVFFFGWSFHFICFIGA